MTTKTTPRQVQRYTPDELKILVDALNGAPSYLSKRFILKHLCGWSDELIAENMRLKMEEKQQEKIGDLSWR
jgi:DNA-directed RNA polymerase specialized sigma24 family protein